MHPLSHSRTGQPVAGPLPGPRAWEEEGQVAHRAHARLAHPHTGQSNSCRGCGQGPIPAQGMGPPLSRAGGTEVASAWPSPGEPLRQGLGGRRPQPTPSPLFFLCLLCECWVARAGLALGQQGGAGGSESIPLPSQLDAGARSAKPGGPGAAAGPGEAGPVSGAGPVLQFFTRLRRHASLDGASPYFKVKKWKLEPSQRASSLDTRGELWSLVGSEAQGRPQENVEQAALHPGRGPQRPPHAGRHRPLTSGHLAQGQSWSGGRARAAR